MAVAGLSGGPRARAALTNDRPKSGYFEYEQTMTLRAGRPLTTDQKVWFKGQSYRQESVSTGSKIVTLGGPQGTFALLPGRPDAMQLSGPIRQSTAGIPGLFVLDSASVKRFAKRVGTTKVGRYQTDVYEWRNVFQGVGGTKGKKAPARQEITTRYWISKDLPAPVKVSVPNMGPQGGTVVTLLKAARLNPTLPDSLFQLPKGMKVSSPAPPRKLSLPGSAAKK
jgi:hypothetical protein